MPIRTPNSLVLDLERAIVERHALSGLQPVEQGSSCTLRVVPIGEDHDEGRLVRVLHAVALDVIIACRSAPYRLELTHLRVPGVALEMAAVDADFLLNGIHELAGRLGLDVGFVVTATVQVVGYKDIAREVKVKILNCASVDWCASARPGLNSREVSATCGVNGQPSSHKRSAYLGERNLRKVSGDEHGVAHPSSVPIERRNAQLDTRSCEVSVEGVGGAHFCFG